MTNKTEFLKELRKLWAKYPQERFGQLLFNYTRFGTRTRHMRTIVDIFNYEDNDILKEIKTEVNKK